MKKITCCFFLIFCFSAIFSSCTKDPEMALSMKKNKAAFELNQERAEPIQFLQANEEDPEMNLDNYSYIVKSEKKSSKRDSDPNKIDFDFTRYNYTMASALIFDMLINQEDYLGKRIRIKGKFFADEDENGRFFAVLLYDATACCQTGFTFEDSSRKYPEDFPEQLEEIEITGVYSKKFYGNVEYTYIDCAK